jgi:hypothetical protein
MIRAEPELIFGSRGFQSLWGSGKKTQGNHRPSLAPDLCQFLPCEPGYKVDPPNRQ